MLLVCRRSNAISHIALKRNQIKMMSTYDSILYDMPVSNHGARIRYILHEKNLFSMNKVAIRKPDDIGGLKSTEYLNLNPLGKMPMLVIDDNYPIYESDTIARYIIDRYSNINPTFHPSTIYERVLSDQICRIHDVYISNIQGCMYKPAGFVFSVYGTNRLEALNELLRQLKIVEDTVQQYAIKYNSDSSNSNTYITGSGNISLADVTLYPTIIFCEYILPQFFSLPLESFLGPRLSDWYKYISTTSTGKIVRGEIVPALEAWRGSGRFDLIVKEINETSKK